jgi:hypothetical protein
MIDFRSYSAIESALFVKWTIPNFETAYLSDYNTNITFGGNTYTSIGKLMNISSTKSELKSSPQELSIGLSGIPTSSVSNVLTKEIKGSTIEIYRGFFDATTHNLLTISGSSNPILKFKGIVTNYDVSDDVDIDAQIATTSITLTCASIVEVLMNKTSGRRTNPVDFVNESSMNRVPALANSNFNFGAPSA